MEVYRVSGSGIAFMGMLDNSEQDGVKLSGFESHRMAQALREACASQQPVLAQRARWDGTDFDSYEVLSLTRCFISDLEIGSGSEADVPVNVTLRSDPHTATLEWSA